MTLRQLVFAVSTRFLPATAVIVGATLFLEPIIRRQSIRATLSQVYLPLAIGEPVLISMGAVAALWLLRRNLDDGALLSVGRNAFAAVIAVGALFVTSVFSQGAHMPFIITINLLAGACGALVAFGSARTAQVTA